MIGRKKHVILFCLALAVLFLPAGCATVQDDSYVVRDDKDFSLVQDGFISYKDADRGGEKFYAEDPGAEEIRYVARDGELIRITPEKPAEVATGEVLEPIAAEFIGAETSDLLAAFVADYAPSELAFVAVQNMAAPAIVARNWSAAAEIFRQYREKFPSYRNRIDAIVAMLEAPDTGLKVVNLGGAVNTAADEYSPVVSSDGRKIYFARDCGECQGGEEVHVASKGEDGNWSPARRFGEPLSSKGHEIPLGISADGTTLAVYGNYQGSMGRGDIFFVEKTPQGWGGLQHYPAPLNSDGFESNAMYTADGRAILFVSERPGGIGAYHEKDKFFNGSYSGNTDIYVYTLGGESPGEIINLGSVINTPFSEYSPYLHPDGQTLYFSSNGHAGLGGLDLYKTTRLNKNSWTEWSEPVNLGKEINTAYNDWGYQVVAQGDQAYFARVGLGDSFGGSDIYAINLPEKAQPTGVITISGVVTDPNGDPLVADIRWDDLEAGQEVGFASSDPITGEYILHLPYGGYYGYYAEKSGYIGESEHFDLRDYSARYNEYTLDIVLYPIVQPVEMAPEKIVDVGMVEPVVEIKMNNIFFDFNKAELRPESYMEMKRWIRMLQENGHIHLNVTGHTDSIGSEAYNQKLSERRAKSVVGHLIDNGIAGERLVAEGVGESQPVATNETEAGRQQNRRVQVKIINGGK